MALIGDNYAEIFEMLSISRMILGNALLVSPTIGTGIKPTYDRNANV